MKGPGTLPVAWPWKGLFRSFRGELLGGPVSLATFDGAGEVDLVAGDLALVNHLDGVALELSRDGAGDVIPAHLPVRDRGIALATGNGSGQLTALGLERNGRLLGLP